MVMAPHSRARDLMAACLLALSACSDPSGVSVTYDGRPHKARETSAEVGSVGDERWLTVIVTDPGSSAIDDEEWFALTVTFARDEELAPGTFTIDGASTLTPSLAIDTGFRGYPQHTDLRFQANANHDRHVLRAWLWHHYWFAAWDGEQRQQISGTLEIERVESDDTVHGQLQVTAKGGLIPGSPGPDHEIAFRGHFVSDPER
jgi:hypothetical protein